ncbi:hypothetical protein KY359_05260 [Candidatus Woesearchaeota archaeon]|nr:hypothetical protein [Candidatus Woesearchaeota archaeon]
MNTSDNLPEQGNDRIPAGSDIGYEEVDTRTCDDSEAQELLDMIADACVDDVRGASPIISAGGPELPAEPDDSFADFLSDPELGWLSEEGEPAEGHFQSLSSGSMLLQQGSAKESHVMGDNGRANTGAQRVLYDPRTTPDPDSPVYKRKMTSSPVPDPNPTPIPNMDMGPLIAQCTPEPKKPDDEFLRRLKESGRLQDVTEYRITPGDASGIIGDDIIHKGFDDITLVFAILDKIKTNAENVFGQNKFSLSLEDALRHGDDQGFINFDNPEDAEYAITMVTGTDGLVSGRVVLGHSDYVDRSAIRDFISRSAAFISLSIPHLVKGQGLKKRVGVTPAVLRGEIESLAEMYRVQIIRAQRRSRSLLLSSNANYSAEFFRGPYRQDPVVRILLGWDDVRDTNNAHFLSRDQHVTMTIQYDDEHAVPRAYEMFPKDTRLRINHELAAVGPGGRKFSVQTPGIDFYLELE